MNKEIKEILDVLNIAIKHESIVEINFKECKKILDYITNLQEENKKLKSYMQDTYDSANDICGELQQIIDKAIEYIEEHNIIGTNKEYLPSGIEKCYSLELMEILRGDKE